MALMRRGAPAPPPLRLGALLVLCSLSGLAVPVGSGSAAGELSAAALPPLLPLLPPPAALADSRAALHADLKDKTRAQLTWKMDAGEQLADVKAASFTVGSRVRLAGLERAINIAVNGVPDPRVRGHYCKRPPFLSSKG